MLFYEWIIGQVWVGLRNASDFVSLAGAELFIFVEAPDALQQALAAEDFVDAGDAAAEVVFGVEDRGIHVRHLVSHLQQTCGDTRAYLRD